MAWVTWWPAALELRYAELCCGLYEFLRAPPDLCHLQRATDYLRQLELYPDAPLQRHRIRWTRMWIQETKAVFAG